MAYFAPDSSVLAVICAEIARREGACPLGLAAGDLCSVGVRDAG
jgi:hypothetical protein